MNGKLDEPGLTGASPTGPASAVGTGPGAPDSVGGESRQGLEARFHELADVWREESLVMSSVTAMSRLPSYQQIIALGPAVVPLLLRDLEQQPEHWFVALSCLTGANPIPPESRGRMDEMAQAWVRWGRERGYRW